MTILLVGDGRLARELASLIEARGESVIRFFLDDQSGAGPDEVRRALEGLVGNEISLAIEAVISEPTDKWDVVTELDRLLDPEVPILTAALNASATEVASWCQDSGRVVGFAAVPPLADSSTVEWMAALQSTEEARDSARAFWRKLGREPVEIADSVGGVLPRILCCLINEAAFALAEQVASAEDIDLGMMLGTNHPRGPLAWADLIGIDQVVGVLEALGNEFGPDQYRPAPLLRQLARAGGRFFAAEVPENA